MSRAGPSPVGHWRHSFEEDEPGVAVYRPVGYAFPRARGRAALELHTDGACTAWPVGAADAPGAGVPGEWSRLGEGRIAMSFPGSALPDRVVEVGPDLLRVHPGPRFGEVGLEGR